MQTKTPLEQLRECGLTETQMRRMAMYHFDGLKQSKIAEIEGCIERNIRRSIHAATAKMQLHGLFMRPLRDRKQKEALSADPFFLNSIQL